MEHQSIQIDVVKTEDQPVPTGSMVKQQGVYASLCQCSAKHELAIKALADEMMAQKISTLRTDLTKVGWEYL